jgi:hypothetical protein
MGEKTQGDLSFDGEELSARCGDVTGEMTGKNLMR